MRALLYSVAELTGYLVCLRLQLFQRVLGDAGVLLPKKIVHEFIPNSGREMVFVCECCHFSIFHY